MSAPSLISFNNISQFPLSAAPYTAVRPLTAAESALTSAPWFKKSSNNSKLLNLADICKGVSPTPGAAWESGVTLFVDNKSLTIFKCVWRLDKLSQMLCASTKFEEEQDCSFLQQLELGYEKLWRRTS